MNKIAAFFILLISALSFTFEARAEKLDEIKQYFELRDTISLVNLELKRALAPDSKSPLLKNKNSEQELTRLVMFLEDRVRQFSQVSTPLKYHYRRNLETLLAETKYLYSNLVVRTRSIAAKRKPDNLMAKESTAQMATSSIILEERPYFKPIDLRTLLSPALLKSGKLAPFKDVWANNAGSDRNKAKNGADETAIAIASTSPSMSEPAKKPASKSVVENKIYDKNVSNQQTKASNNEITRPEHIQKIEKAKPANIEGVNKGPIIVAPPSEISVQNTPPVEEGYKPEFIAPDKKEPVEVVSSISAASGASEIKPVVVASTAQYLRPLAVMIENHHKARPQSGLHEAEVVYEIPVEGGITRFMALFLHVPSLLGPVRSCREYFVDRALEVNAVYVHCGGSPKGYAYLSKTRIDSIDEIKHGKPFFRDHTRKAPHNLYTTGKKLFDYLSERFQMKVDKKPSPLNYGPVPTSGTLPGKSVFIRYHGNYKTFYKFNNGHYERYMNGIRHIDRDTKKPINPETVIIQTSTMRTVDDKGRQEISFVGSGSAVIFHKGTMIPARWSKKSPKSLTNYTDLAGKSIVFEEGKPVWIQVVSPNLKVSFNLTEDQVADMSGNKSGKTVLPGKKVSQEEKKEKK
ncbi:MAG: hypothetical protein Kow0029_21000 [Candidatus Rifleibacteriota bacterium]